eukprot:173396_1
MAHEIFENKRQCETPRSPPLSDPRHCLAVNRIKIILHEFNDDPLHKDRRGNESKLMDKFASIFISHGYTNTSLLNDFHHIKYAHNVDDNNTG